MAAESEFFASYDTTTKVVSAGTAVVVLLVAIATQSVAIGCLAAALYFVSYAFSPGRYTISGDSIMVHRLFGTIRIPLAEITEIRRASSEDLTGVLRLWGNGGLFGYYGLFRTSKLGKCSWYVTNRQNMVVLITSRKTTLFSPDDVDGFLAAIRAAVPVPNAPAASKEQLHPLSGLGNLIAKFVGFIVAILVLAIVVVAFTYAPGPPSYTLTATSLTIHDRFYPITLSAAEVDADHMQPVNIATDLNWKPVERTNGFANGHYRSGWFRVANGQKVRLYWAESTKLVLLPPNGSGTAVLLEVKDPESFMGEVRRQWSLPR